MAEVAGDILTSMTIPVLVDLFLTRPSVVATLRIRGFEVMPVDRQGRGAVDA
jgi:hypothetical protein